MKCTTIEEALNHYNEVTGLYLKGEECKKANTEEIEKFTNLKSLHFLPNIEEWSTFPEGFKKLELDVLQISGVRINELLGMKIKHLGIQLAHIDLVPLCKNFPDLEELSLAFGNAEFSIPKEIEQLTNLQKLSIKQGTLTNVANEIKNLTKLKSLELHGLGFEELPIEFTTIPNVDEVTLKNFYTLTTLPEEIKNWKVLEKINFKFCFKGREEKSFEDELFIEDKPNALPAAISGLKNLKEIRLEFCPIQNLDPLAELSHLEEIHITQAKLNTIDAVKNLTRLKKIDIKNSYDLNNVDAVSKLINLEYLDISSSKITSLEPLHKLTKLEYLNIKGCTLDKSNFNVKNALLPLYHFENLKTVKSSHLTEEEWTERDKNEASKKKFSPEEIIAVLENKESSLTTIEEVLNAIGDMEFVFNVKKHDAYDSTLEIPALDTIVSTYAEKLSKETLKKLISVSFADTGMGDSYEVTTIVIREFIKRKSVAGQNHVVDAFINCMKYYDAGHRYFGSTVHDQLIDDFLPQFEIEPLAKLILSLGSGIKHPEYGDGICELYAPIFSKMKEENTYEAEIVGDFTNFIFENIDESIILDIIDDVLEEDISNDTREVIEKIKNIASRTHKALQGESASDFEMMLKDVLNGDLPSYFFNDYDLERSFENFNIQELSFDLLLNVFDYTFFAKSYTTLNNLNKVLFSLDREKLTTYLEDISEDNEEVTQMLIKVLNYKVSSTEKKYIDKDAYESFALEFKYKLQGKTEEDIARELAERKGAELKKAAAKNQNNKLKEAFQQSLANGDNSIFITESKKVISEEQLNDYSFDMSNFTTKLLINSLMGGDFNSAKNVFLNFTENLLPVVGISHKTDDVASNAIVLAIMAKDKEVESLVFEKLLPKDFKAKDVSNEVLAFNLSCFYAKNEKKEDMLGMIKQSLNLGKQAKQFQTDSDFEAYWQDQDFIEVLKA
ncbi:leucine-rich repeat domain-containing protein [uncultured Tenacibaculum sp.]|uniref:leucine-rich repeat domain-containing protein n=1 Tax=uncultured Tenacibaculum sp. TaxID=174713 RepID=UPI00260F5A0F|nr:leucine-rich repeat domain-containing protein [uncultured Tenacibaculum sp.]